MDVSEGTANAGFGHPVQIAYACTDVRAAAYRWVDFGAGPFFIRDHIAVDNVRVRGLPATFDHSSAYGQWGPVMVELICEHDGGTNPLVPATGLHHMAFLVDDFGDATGAVARQSCPEALYAEAGGMPFAFHDARPTLGHFIEIYEAVPRLVAFYDMVRDAAVGWTGADPLREL